MAAAGAEKPAAATPAAGKQQEEQEQLQREALFAAKHAELLSEARGVAREHGVSVRALAFRPDGSAVAHELIGVGREDRLAGVIQRVVARDVSEMGLQEVAAHHRQLRALRAAVLSELDAKKKAAAAGKQ